MGQNWAIVVGINEYSNLRRLNYAERDAVAVRDFFGELGFERVYFFAKDAPGIAGDSGADFSAEPTFGELSNFLDRRFATAFLKPGDNLWFFFAGHGRRDREQDYLMLRDSNPGNVARSGLKIQELAAVLRRSGAGNVILLLDACRDEGSRDGLGIGGQRQQGVITFYACAASQQSYEIEELESGAFTYALLQGLRLRGEDGNCGTVERLAQHLRVSVPALVERYKGMVQNPVLALDPDSKRDAILLPKLARSSDVQALKNHAYRYQSRGDRETARELWIQVLAASPADLDAVEEIERLASGNSVRQRSETGGGSRSSLKEGMPALLAWLESIPSLLEWLSSQFTEKTLSTTLFTITLLFWSFLVIFQLSTPTLSDFSSQKSSSTENAILLFSKNDIKGGVEVVSALLDQGNLDDASKALNGVNSRDLDHPSISYLRGRLVMENIRRRKNSGYSVSDARRAFLRATEDEPKNPAYLNALGFSYYEEADVEQAQEAWSQVVDLSDSKEYSNDNSELLTAKAGMALVCFKKSEKRPECKSRAIKLRDEVLETANLKNLQDWRWSESAISDWKKLMELK